MTPPGRPAVIALEDLGLTYPGPPPVTALHPCELRIEHGELVTIVGPSGSGKSSLLNVLGLLDSPTRGRYLLNGVDTSTVNDGRRAALRGQQIGFVFQSFHLLPHRTAQENVELAMVYQRTPRRVRRRKAAEVLARVGLAHRAHALPTRLSGGERQRVAIARALVAEPALLLCDEPTGNLDSDTAGAILDLLDQLHRDGMTILVITHDANVARRGRRVITIRDGVLSETTPGAEAAHDAGTAYDATTPYDAGTAPGTGTAHRTATPYDAEAAHGTSTAHGTATAQNTATAHSTATAHHPHAPHDGTTAEVTR